MQDSLAQSIFWEIQSRPYGLSLNNGESSNNCYFKGIELLQKLSVLGYAVRGRIGETYWPSDIIPADILSLLPTDIKVTHFFAEILLDNNWSALDPSFQPELAKYGFTIGGWGTNSICFPITKLYTQEESIAYQQQWFNTDYQRDFFERGKPCWTALNNWFEKLSHEN